MIRKQKITNFENFGLTRFLQRNLQLKLSIDANFLENLKRKNRPDRYRHKIKHSSEEISKIFCPGTCKEKIYVKSKYKSSFFFFLETNKIKPCERN